MKKLLKQLKLNIIKLAKSLLLLYLPLILLLVVALIRFVSFTKPSNVQKEITQNIVVNQPVQVEQGQKLIYSTNLKVVSYNVPFVEMGDIISVIGDRYYSTIYADQVKKVGESKLKPLYTFKQSLINHSNALLLNPFSSLLNGMLLGVKPTFSEQFNNLLIKTGVIHIIVVSGFNIAVLVSFTAKVFSFLSVKFRLYLSLLVIVTYSFIVGFEPPVVRALIMGIIVGFASSYGFVKNTLYILFISALIMVIINPAFLLMVSFQLSFLSSFGIILLSNKLSEFFSFFPSVIKEGLVSSLSAQIFVLPLIYYYFGQVSIIGLLVNPLVLWVVPIVMLIGVVFIFLSFLGLYAFVKPFLFILYAPLVFFVDVIQNMSNWSGKLVVLILLAVITSTLITKKYYKSGFKVISDKQESSLIKSLVSICVFVSILFVYVSFKQFVSPFKNSDFIAFLNVGQGDALVIGSGGEYIVVDAGPSSYSLNKLYKYTNLNYPKAFIFTHSHSDHISGFTAFPNTPTYYDTYLTNSINDNFEYKKLEKLKLQSPQRVKTLVRGDNLRFNNFTLQVLWPNLACHNLNLNHCSLALLVKHTGGKKALLLADNPTFAQESYLHQVGDVSIIKVPHQGSDLDFTSTLYKTTNTKVAIISVGKNNYGHPGPKLTNFLQQQGIKTYRTDKNGDTVIIFK